MFAFECVGQKNWLHCDLFPKHPVRFRHQEKLLAFLFLEIFFTEGFFFFFKFQQDNRVNFFSTA